MRLSSFFPAVLVSSFTVLLVILLTGSPSVGMYLPDIGLHNPYFAEHRGRVALHGTHWEKLLSHNLLLLTPVVLSTKVDCLANYIQLFETI